jgi:hypothetical protein
MFEALGESSDRELMLVSLDLLDAIHSKDFPPKKLNFILFNPTPMDRSATITVPPAGQQSVRFSVNGATTSNSLRIPKQSYVRLLAEF